MKKSKRYASVFEKVEKNKLYSVDDAVKLVKETSNSKFDETIEVAMNLNLDTKKADQQLRGAIVLPNGTGKQQTVLVLAKGDQAKAAKEAGADYVGDVDMITKIEKENWFSYDVIIATPEMMPLLGKIGKILGPKGLMPNPKTGTVTMDVAKAVNDTKKGKVEYRTDKVGNVQVPVGKISFSNEKLAENIAAIYRQNMRIKPQTVKGVYIQNLTVTSTMGPGIKVSPDEIA